MDQEFTVRNLLASLKSAPDQALIELRFQDMVFNVVGVKYEIKAGGKGAPFIIYVTPRKK